MTLCGSHPWCSEEALPGKRFCAKDQAELDRIKAGEPKDMIVESPKPKQSSRGRGAALTAAILQAFTAGQQLNGTELAAACEVHPNDATYKRARKALIDAGKIKAEGIGRSMVYRLAPD